MVKRKVLHFKKSSSLDQYGKPTYQDGIEKWVGIVEKAKTQTEDLSEEKQSDASFFVEGDNSVRRGDYFVTDLTTPVAADPEAVSKDKKYRVMLASNISAYRKLCSVGELAI